MTRSNSMCGSIKPSLRKQNPGASADVIEMKARELLEGQRVDKNFADWLEQQRKSTRIEYKPEAFS